MPGPAKRRTPAAALVSWPLQALSRRYHTNSQRLCHPLARQIQPVVASGMPAAANFAVPTDDCATLHSLENWLHHLLPLHSGGNSARSLDPPSNGTSHALLDDRTPWTLAPDCPPSPGHPYTHSPGFRSNCLFSRLQSLGHIISVLEWEPSFST